MAPYQMPLHAIPSFVSMPDGQSDTAEKGISRPWFDASPWSKGPAIAGLGLSWIFGVLCIIAGAFPSVRPAWQFGLSPMIFYRILSLTMNGLITLCNESMGFIHTVSLRWALHREGKLTCNSSLRLLTFPRQSPPNAWYSNLVMFTGIVCAYTSSSLLVLEAEFHSTVVCNPALIVLGIGILLQAIIATWALSQALGAPTWSFNALDTAAAALHYDPILIRRPDRAMMGVEMQTQDTVPMKPRDRQSSVQQAHTEVRAVVILAWAVVLAGTVWAGLTSYLLVILPSLSRPHSWFGQREGGPNWNLLPQPQTPGYIIWTGDDYFQNVRGNMALKAYMTAFSITAGVQLPTTLLLHCAEILVNSIRDEEAWRKAGRDRGTPREAANAVVAVLSSWPAIVLLLSKIIIHWFYGLCCGQYAWGGYWFVPQILYLTVALAVLAALCTFLALRRPKGPQPATYGHLQTLVDLIDHWPGEKERLYWGHKGFEEGPVDGKDGRVGHAGIATEPLEPVQMLEEYQ